MKHVKPVTVTERDWRVARIMAGSLKYFARQGEEKRFEAIASFILDVDLGYCLEAAEWEELNGVPWDAGAGVRVLAERGDRDAQAVLSQAVP